MFVVGYTSIWPNFIMIVVRIQKNKQKCPLCSNVYDDVTYFEICGFHENTKIQVSWEQDIFSSNKKFISYTSRATLTIYVEI